MLPELYQKEYAAFQQALQAVRQGALTANPDVRALQALFLQAQQIFQTRLVSLDLDEADGVSLSQVQSVQTEISKQLRLLGMDLMFLQTARQLVTAQQRQAQICDRLALLDRYCQVLLDKGADPAADSDAMETTDSSDFSEPIDG